MAPHVALREMAFQARSSDLRDYSVEILKRDPARQAASEVLDLMAYLIECDFVAAQAKLETLTFKFKGTNDEIYVNEATDLALAHINFAFGRFSDLQSSAHSFLENHKESPLMEQGEFLDIMRLLAQRAMLLDEFTELSRIYQEVNHYEVEDQSTNLLYLINSIKAMYLMSRGDFLKAGEVANKNITLAKINNYAGLMSPIDSMYVNARVFLAGAKHAEALNAFEEIKVAAESFSQWPWYFYADGYLSRDFALRNNMTEALAIVRVQREKLSTLNFTHELNFIPDINELYVRHLIKDIERMEILIERVPNLLMVQQIKALKQEWAGKDMLKWFKELPEDAPREKIYKLVCFAEYYADKESLAVEYMAQALQLAEETGQVEFILRQYRLFNVILKAISIKPTPFLEYMGTRIMERIQINEEKSQLGIPLPLTNRELEVVRNLATGKPISSIASDLHVSMNTMKTHLRNVYRKLDVEGREKAVIKAKDLFLI
jgi:LuxR family maltose regulon positive regulatory protein